MLKLDPKSIFWSLAVHRYPKRPPRVIIFAAIGPGMKLVIAENFSAKKNENLKFFCKTYVIYIKRKLRTCRIQIQVEKVWFFGKEPKFLDFWIFFPKGGPFGVETVKFFFSIFQNFIILFSKITLMGPNRCWNKQSQEFWWLKP